MWQEYKEQVRVFFEMPEEKEHKRNYQNISVEKELIMHAKYRNNVQITDNSLCRIKHIRNRI